MTQNVPPHEEPAPPHPSAAVDTLRQAMRRARADDAERGGARATLRAVSLGRLELLQEALQPLVAQIPVDIDTFDVALVPAAEPRLFIDMIGFVEMDRDARTYLLNQDTRHGRIRIARSPSLDEMVDAVTDYVARRLLERDKALASDAYADAARRNGGERCANLHQATPPARPAAAAPPVPATVRRNPLRWIGIAFAFLIDLLGAIAFFSILVAIGWSLWVRHGAPT